MKKIYTIIGMVLISLTSYSQVPQKMSFQAVIRDAGGTLIANTTVGMQISILEGSSGGAAVYVETHTPTTNDNGLVSLEVGAGTVVSGDFTTIDWGSDSYYIKTETDPSGGTSYTIIGTSQLISVPYALYANSISEGNTLDQAYDEEMTTNPSTRIINADDGKIEIIATDNRGLEITGDPDYTGLYVTGATALDQTAIYGYGTGDAEGIWGSNGGSGAALYGWHDGTGDALYLYHEGLGKGLNIWNSNLANAANSISVDHDGTSDAVYIDNTQGGGGLGLRIDQAGAGDAVYVDNTLSGGGDGLRVDQAGAGDAVYIDNTAGTGDGIRIDDSGASNGLFVNNLGAGGGIGIRVTQTGAGDAVYFNNLAGGGGKALSIDQAGAGNAVEISNTGTGIGLEVDNGNGVGLGEAVAIFQAAPKTALYVDNAGTSDGVNIFNGNPAGTGEVLEVVQGGTGTAVLVDNGGPGKGIHVFNASPTNTDVTLFASTMGLGIVEKLTTEDNNANLESTMVVENNAAGSAGEFITVDELVGKVNFAPTVNVVSNGKGIGLNVDVINDVFGSDSNTEPAIFGIHRGYGKTAHFETTVSDNVSATVEIINKGAGYGLHVDSFDNPFTDVDATLYVEQANSSTSSVLGRTAVFDLHPSGTSADSAVLIRSSATSGSSSALRVIAASTANLAGVFEGDVEVSSDITIGGTMTAAAKAFKIDHPLFPETKFLVHNSIESNERVNIYSGNITTDEFGYATVQCPDYMSALNTDFKYQLTIVDKSFARAVIWEKMNAENNTFIIKTDTPNIEVSWQITGTRQDTWALNNPLITEMEKETDVAN